MLKRNYIPVLLLAACLSASAQPAWKDYTDEKGGFKIQFRGEPSLKTEKQDVQFFDLTWMVAMTDTPDELNLSYSVKYVDVPNALISSDSIDLLAPFFELTQVDMVPLLGENGFDNVVMKEIQKYPGREFRWVDKPKSLGYTRRVFLVKNRIYFLEVKYKLAKAFNIDIQRFLNKFELVNKADNPNPERAPEKPVKKFEATFPGQAKSKDNAFVDDLFGNVYGMLEAYEVPDDQKNLSRTKNIMYGVNYAKLPAEKLKTTSKEKVREFVRRAFTDNIKSQQNGEILLQKEISLNGYWGYEGQGTLLNGMAVMHLRAFVVKDYYYQVIVISKYGTQNNKEALDFLDSFRLKNE